MHLVNGTAIGDYQITGVVGEGAFGTVYSAVHPVIGKKAAIKVLKQSAAESAETVQRFKYEARAVNAIEHPNIVDIFGYGSLPDGRPYLIMEYLRGQSLQGLIRAHGGRVPPEIVIAILRDVAGAVDAAHESGVIHRDLKPDNIFVAEYGRTTGDSPAVSRPSRRSDGHLRVKVLDFGIAKLTSSSMATQQGRQMGTPLFMAPEQCFGQPISPRVDVYAFGVVAFYCLTGAFPIYADSMVAIVGKHMMGEYRTPSSFGAEFAAFDRPMVGLVAAAPEQRYPSLSAGWEALDEAYRGATSRPAASLPAGPLPASSLPQQMATPALSTNASTLGTASGAVPSPPQGPVKSRALVWTVTGLVTIAIAGLTIAVAVQALRPQPKPAEYTRALDNTRRLFLEEKWQQAIIEARVLLDGDPDDEQARELFERARRELKNQQLYALFDKATRDRPVSAMNVAILYETIPEDSAYRAKATPQYAGVRSDWLEPRAARARTLLAAGHCGQLLILAQEVGFVFPESSSRFEGLAAKCSENQPGAPLAARSPDSAPARVARAQDRSTSRKTAGPAAPRPKPRKARSRGDRIDDGVDEATVQEAPQGRLQDRRHDQVDTPIGADDMDLANEPASIPWLGTAAPEGAGPADPPPAQSAAGPLSGRLDAFPGAAPEVEGAPSQAEKNRRKPQAEKNRRKPRATSRTIKKRTRWSPAPAPTGDDPDRARPDSGGDRVAEQDDNSAKKLSSPAILPSPAQSGRILDRLSRADITRGIDSVRSRLVACGSEHPGGGLVQVEVEVAPTGAVSNVSVARAPRGDLSGCVAAAVEQARFRKSPQGGRFSYPFVF
ncbi:MAG: protein kinase [Proteobacteria bacterium]|nr:protein kinase [Pseudomonadota bacterium]